MFVQTFHYVSALAPDPVRELRELGLDGVAHLMLLCGCIARGCLLGLERSNQGARHLPAAQHRTCGTAGNSHAACRRSALGASRGAFQGYVLRFPLHQYGLKPVYQLLGPAPLVVCHLLRALVRMQSRYMEYPVLFQRTDFHHRYSGVGKG